MQCEFGFNIPLQPLHISICSKFSKHFNINGKYIIYFTSFRQCSSFNGRGGIEAAGSGEETEEGGPGEEAGYGEEAEEAGYGEDAEEVEEAVYQPLWSQWRPQLRPQRSLRGPKS